MESNLLIQITGSLGSITTCNLILSSSVDTMVSGTTDLTDDIYWPGESIERILEVLEKNKDTIEMSVSSSAVRNFLPDSTLVKWENTVSASNAFIESYI